MKFRNIILPLLSFSFVGGAIISQATSTLNVGYANENQPEFAKDAITLDIFAEYDLELVNYSTNVTYTWESSDTSILTVNNGHVSCQGKVGEATVTVRCGENSDQCVITTKNQMINPSIQAENHLGFVNVETFPEVYVRYDGNLYDLANPRYTVADTTIAGVGTNGGIIGKQVGTTTVTVDATWKGKTLKSKKFSLEIQPENSIVLPQSEYHIYSVDETSRNKQNKVEITGDVYLRGQLKNEALGVKLPANPYLTTNGNVVSLAAEYNSNEVTTLDAKVYVINKPEVETDIKIVIHPNFIEMNPEIEIEETYKAKLNFGYESFKGHENAYKYQVVNDPLNFNATNNTWAAWDSRIEFTETTTKNGMNAYNDMMEKGYTLLSFDFYYTGEKGILMGAYGPTAKEYFYNGVQINRSDMLVVNSSNVATNILTNDQWYTIYLDISEITVESMISGQDSAALYVAPCFVGDICYFDNIRYYYDFAPLNDIEIAFDIEERIMNVDDKNVNKATTENEFVVYSPINVSYTYNSDNNTYKYNSENAGVLDRESRSKIRPANLVNGNAVRNGYKYFAFTYIYEAGTPILYYFNNFINAYKTIQLIPNTVIDNNFVTIYKNGRQIEKFTGGEEITVVVKIDGKVLDSMYLTSSVTTKFSLGNFTYYKDISYLEDYSYEEPFYIVIDPIENVFVGTVIDLKQYINVIYKNKPVRNFTLSGFRFSSNMIEFHKPGVFTITDLGTLNFTFYINYEGLTNNVELSLEVKKDSYLILQNDLISLYCGEESYFEKEYTIEPLAFYQQKSISPEKLTYTLLNNSGAVAIENNKIVAVKEGYDIVEVALPNKEATETIYVEVFNEYRKGSFEIVSSDAGLPATYKQYEGTVYGVTNPYVYSASTASWNNKLDISETKHTTMSQSKNNIINHHLNKVTYMFLLTPSTTLRAASLNSQGKHTNIRLEAGKTLDTTNNDCLEVLDQNGNKVTTLQANTWYYMNVDYSYFKDTYVSGYTCHELTYLSGNIYINDIRYYHQ